MPRFMIAEKSQGLLAIRRKVRQAMTALFLIVISLIFPLFFFPCYFPGLRYTFSVPHSAQVAPKN